MVSENHQFLRDIEIPEKIHFDLNEKNSVKFNSGVGLLNMSNISVGDINPYNSRNNSSSYISNYSFINKSTIKNSHKSLPRYEGNNIISQTDSLFDSDEIRKLEKNCNFKNNLSRKKNDIKKEGKNISIKFFFIFYLFYLLFMIFYIISYIFFDFF